MPALPARSPVSDAVRLFVDRVPPRVVRAALPTTAAAGSACGALVRPRPAERAIDATPRTAVRLAAQALSLADVAGLRRGDEPAGDEPAGDARSVRLGDAGPERRGHPRHAVCVRCDARRLDHSPGAMRRGTVGLVVRDVSAGGVGATSADEVAVGERVVVHFPPRGRLRGFDARGRVVRSAADRAGGFRLGIRFDAASTGAPGATGPGATGPGATGPGATGPGATGPTAATAAAA